MCLVVSILKFLHDPLFYEMQSLARTVKCMHIFDSTLMYVNIEKVLLQDGNPEKFHVKIAQTPKE